MPLGEGFWLHTNGKTIPVHEHFSAVLGNLRTYGVTQEDATRRPGEVDDVFRRRVLEIVLRHGWIRVRTHRGHTIFEAWKFTRRATDAVCGFIEEWLGAGAFATYNLHELATGKTAGIKGNRCYEEIDAQLHGAHERQVSREIVYRAVRNA